MLAYYLLIAMIAHTLLSNWYRNYLGGYFEVNPWLLAFVSLLWPLLLLAIVSEKIMNMMK